MLSRGHVLGVVLLALASFLFLSPATAQKEDKEIEVESKAVIYKAAAAIDFRGTFGLDWQCLGSVGARIDKLRRDCDPVALALVAKEVQIAEEISGKEATITAEKLLKEAIVMVKERDHSSELQALAKLIKDSAVSDALQAQAKDAKIREDKEAMKFKAGEEDRGIHYLRVRNNHYYPAHVHVNSHVVGTVPKRSTRTFHLPHAQYLNAKYTRLYAHELAGGKHTWSKTVIGKIATYNWVLN